MPEGDSLARIARALQPLVGERLAIDSPHPRAQLLHLAERLDRKRLEAVEAQGKNLLLRFEGGLVRALPAARAVVVIGLGLAMTLRALPEVF